MTDRAIRPIKIIDRDKCIGCAGYANKKNRWRSWDECYSNFHIPDYSVDCPFYSSSHYTEPIDPYTHNFTGYSIAVTSKLAEIIADGVNSRKFSCWGVSMYNPGLNCRSSRGQMKGFGLHTYEYGQRNRIICTINAVGNSETPSMRIWDIVTAEIREDDTLYLATAPESGHQVSWIIIPIIDAPLDLSEIVFESKNSTKPQKSIFEYIEV